MSLLRSVSSLVTLAASFVVARPRATVRAAQVAADVMRCVRRAPVLRRQPRLLAPIDALAPIVSLVSDTHVCVDSQPPTELAHDPGHWPWEHLPGGSVIANGLSRVLADIAERAPSTVLWCGDEVDTGSPAEWARLREIAASAQRLVHHLVPGNHDINFNLPFVIDHDLSRRAARIDMFETHARPVGQYPVVDTIASDAGTATIVLLDSCRHPSTHILSNAIGRFGEEQLARLEQILHCVRGPVLVVSHHHVWRDPRFTHVETWFNTAVDADRLAEILIAYRRRGEQNHVLVCHGHRHAFVCGQMGPVDAPISVLGLPSTTLGDRAITGQLDGILRYAIAGLARHGHGWKVAVRELGALQAQSRRARRRRPLVDPALRAYAASSLRLAK